MVSQHEDRHVVRRLVAPPPLPALVRPRTPNRAEHVPPENPGAEPAHAAFGDAVVDAGLAVRFPVHAAPRAGLKQPFHELGSVDTERVLKVLARSGTVAV